MPIGQSNQKKTRAMVARSQEDGKESFTCVNMEIPRSSGNSKKSNLNRLTRMMRQYTLYSTACGDQSNDGLIYIGVDRLNHRTLYPLY